MTGAQAPWVIVAGGAHQRGGMDKANAALVSFLSESGRSVHLVAHDVASEIERLPGVTTYRVPRVGGALVAELALDRRGRTTARRITAANPEAIVLVNGSNCIWPGVNWCHYVHAAWRQRPRVPEPLWSQAKRTVDSAVARVREARAYRAARLVISNSELSTRELVKAGLCAADKVKTVYLGCDADWGTADASERATARAEIGIPDGRRVALFVGALGFDDRKGLGPLLKAWAILSAEPGWDVDLLVAGGGRALPHWRRVVAASGLERRVRLLGFRDDVRTLLAAADVFVSPALYEPYGLNVQEAICRGVPALVSVGAGVAERYPADMRSLLLDRPDDPAQLVDTLRRWRSQTGPFKEACDRLGTALRGSTWDKMAAQFVGLVLSTAGDRR